MEIVGREREIATLDATLERAVQGQGGLVLLAGEPGIGKTTLCYRLAARAADLGAPTLWGRCYEGEGAPAYWPWIQVLRSWLDLTDESNRVAMAGSAVAEITRLVPESGLADEAPEPLREDEEARFRQLDELSRFLCRAGPHSSRVIALEDLHWADVASLRLLEHLTPLLHGSSTLVVGTYRDTDVVRGHPLERALGTIRREPATTHIALRGLRDHEVHQLARESGGGAVPPAALATITRTADGNPFYVRELLRLISDQVGAPLGRLEVPSGIRDVIRRRIDGLGDDVLDVLRLAAVIGRDFDLTALAALTGTADVAEKAVDVALSRAVVVEDPADPTRLRFAHALVREVLYEDIPLRQRAALHLDVATRLEGADLDAPGTIEALAHHHLAAARPGAGEAAVRWAVQAATLARQRLAFETAVDLLDRALVHVPEADRDRRYEILLELGRMRFLESHFEGSRQALESAADVACGAGDPVREAEALLSVGYERLRFQSFVTSSHRLDAALRRLGDARPDLRVRLLGRIADATVDHVTGLALALEAAVLARSVPDPQARRMGLSRLAVVYPYDDSLGPQDVLRAEIEALDSDPLSAAHYDVLCLRSQSLLMRGDLDGAEHLLPEIADVEAALGIPSFMSFDRTRVLYALLRGRFDDAEALASVSTDRALSDDARSSLAEVQANQLWALGRERGRLRPIVPAIAAMAASGVDAVLPALALSYAEVDRHEDARRVLDRLLELELPWSAIPFAVGWGGLSWAAEAAATCGASDAAAQLADELVPLGGEVIVVGMPLTLCPGAADHARGRALLTAGDPEGAVRALRSAAALHERMGAPGLTARSRLHLAEALTVIGEQDEALRLTKTASDAARTLGMDRVLDDAARLLARPGAAPRGTGRAHEGTLTLVFTDIESSTQRAAAMGDRAWLPLLRRHNEIVRTTTAHHGGREVKALGDGFMLSFSSARSAVDGAIAIQRALADGGLRVRIGVHTGEAEAEGDDLLGHHVNLAARIAGSASGGQIVVSATTHAITSAAGDLRFDPVRLVALKGLDGDVAVYPLIWD